MDTNLRVFDVSFNSVIKKFLPKEHLKLLTVTDHGLAFDSAMTAGSMYGSSKELSEEVQQFRSFPGSRMVFEGKLTDHFATKPNIYRSLKGDSYIFKQDVFNCLFHDIFTCVNLSQEVVPMISFYLRCKENKLGTVCNLIRFHPEAFQELHVKLHVEFQNRPGSLKLETKTYDEVFEKIKQILPQHEKDKNYKSIRQALESQNKGMPVMENVKIYENLLNNTSSIVRMLDAFMEEHPEWCNPRPLVLSSENEEPCVVRQFVDGGKKFVLAAELLFEARRAGLDTDSYWDEYFKNGDVRVIPFDDLPSLIGVDQVEQIEFVVTPIPRTKHRAVYIPSIHGGYIISASDLILEIMRIAISEQKYFQNASQTESLAIWCVIDAIGNKIDEIEKQKDSHFVKMEKFVDLKIVFLNRVRRIVSEQCPGSDVLIKTKLDILKVGPDGFTVEDAEEEMKRMGLVATFPSITKFLVKAYQLIDVTKTGDVLRTCDMYRLLELCQQMCLLQRSEGLNKCFHKYGLCVRLHIMCTVCRQEAKEAESNAKDDELQKSFASMTTGLK